MSSCKRWKSRFSREWRRRLTAVGTAHLLGWLGAALCGLGISSAAGPFDFAVYATRSDCGAITISGNAYTDSFDSSQGTYVQTRQLSNGDIGVVGNASLKGAVVVNGTLFALNTTVGPCRDGVPGIALTGNAHVTGGYLALKAAPVFAAPPAVTPGSQDLGLMSDLTLPPGNYGNVTVGFNATLTLSPGTYNINSLKVAGNSVLTVNPPGQVILNVAGNKVSQAIDFTGGSLSNPSGIPLNFQLIYGGNLPVVVSGGSAAYAVLYAPNAAASLHGGSDWFGAMVVGTLDDAGGVALHYDRSLATPPSIKATITPPPNAGGWNNTNVTVSFTCSDPVFAIVSCSAPVQVTTEGTNQRVTGTAVNQAGYSASTSVTVNIDKTPPSISAAKVPPPNAAGWNNTDVTVAFTCSDALSGVQTCPAPVTVSAEGAGQLVTGTAVDKAGNTATAGATINLDKTAPTITAAITPAPNAGGWNNTNVTVSFTCTDALSGMATCPAPVTVSTETAGQVIAGTAVDKAGNTATASVTVKLDKTAPTITAAAAPAPNTAGWNNSAVTVTFTCTDAGSGIDELPVAGHRDYGSCGTGGVRDGQGQSGKHGHGERDS